MIKCSPSPSLSPINRKSCEVNKWSPAAAAAHDSAQRETNTPSDKMEEVSDN